MAYYITTTQMGLPAIANTDTVQYAPIGTRVRAVDPTYGEGEFIYLKGIASTVVGSVVIYDEYANTTTLGVAGSRGPVAVAMSANVASQFGWYQIAGSSVVKAATVLAAGATYWTATPGVLDDAVVATDKIDGMRFKTADGTPAAGFAVVSMDRASASGNG